MAGRNSRVVLNRKALDGVALATADGVFAVAQATIREANPPDATPYGQGLVDHGGAAVYFGSKKIDGFSLDGTQPQKPRAVRTPRDGEIVAFAGWSFPANLQERGSVHQPARPFFLPAVNRVIPRAPGIIRQAAAYRIARLKSLGRA